MSTRSGFSDAVSSARERKKVDDHQASPTSVTALSIDVNSPQDHQSVSSSIDSKSRRNRRRRKGKARGNQLEADSPSTPSRSRNHNNNKKKKKNSSNYTNGNGNNESGQQQQSSTFRTPIVTWRGGNRSYPSKNNRSNSSNSNSNQNQNQNRHSNKNWNHPSPRFKKNAGSSPGCPASTGYPTSKKQHDAPMKKRDLYFSLHVERVGIASNQSKIENTQNDGSEPDPQSGPQEQKAVARVTLTNWENEFVLDTFVAIPVPVSDFYDTGIQPEHVKAKAIPSSETTTANVSHESCVAADASDSWSCSFAATRAKVERILRGKILIGYELDEGLQALGLSHPDTDTRDCSVYFRKNGASTSVDNHTNPVSQLEGLSQLELNRTFESAKAKILKDYPNNKDVMVLPKDISVNRRPEQICVTTMDLYKKRRSEWETALIVQARERDQQQRDYLLKISEQRKKEQNLAQFQARQQAQKQHAQQQRAQQQHYREIMPTVSLHCETVQTALTGRAKTLARVTVVDGPSRNVLLDEFAQIPVPATAFGETGITGKDVMIENNADAYFSSNRMPLSVLRGHAERILRGRLLVGYKVEESLKALSLSHPWMEVRDIAYFPPFLHRSTSVVTVRSLDELSQEFLRQQLRPPGDRSRPLDLCQSALALYETFRDQWERQSHTQQQDSFIHRHNQQQQVHHNPHLLGRMIPPSPSTMMQSPHLRSNHYYGQQPRTDAYNSSMMMTPPPQHQPERQVLMPEQQQQCPEAHSRTNSNSSSWFPWMKQQQQQQNNVIAASQTLSTQAFQVLQEGSFEEGNSSPRNALYSIASTTSGGSAFVERRRSCDGSAYDGSEVSGVTSEVFTVESMVSSMYDETSSVISGDQQALANNPESKSGSSSLPSSWFRFGLKKPKDKAQGETKSNGETMAAVQETEVLTDDGMLPPPTMLFPPEMNSGDDARKPLQKTKNTEGRDDDDSSASSSASPLVPRNWFGFRKSPVQKERSRSPASYFSGSTIDDLAIATLPEGPADTATEASIEITLSIPASSESGDTILPLVEKNATTTLSCRPSTSWFGFRRSSKSNGPDSSNINPNTIGKNSDQSETFCHQDLKPAPTERTTTMDDDWLHDITSQSRGSPQKLEPWMNETGEAKSEELIDKSLSTSRGQASWFAFKRSKAIGSNKTSRLFTSLNPTDESFKEEASSEDGTWSHDAPTNENWLPQETNIPTNIVHSNDANIEDIFHTRSRLPTESTIPSVTSEEEHTESFSKDFDFGAAQSFNFLKI